MSNKKYFAFISYSHKDSELAKWLQHEFEYYELPATLFDERKDLHKEDFPKSFRPVFRDEDELSGGELKPQISEALADSEYLIVVCSPNSAQSLYVNKEIKEFINLSQVNKRRIFPFIVDGKPHQDDEHKEMECFPKSLLELSNDVADPIELIAGDIKTTGRDHAFVKILAGTLNEKNIRFADLWNRYAIEKAEKERKERENKEKLLIAQSRFIAEKANSLLDEGNSYTARKLLLEVLPSDTQPDMPLTIEAERALRDALKIDSAIIIGHTKQINSLSFSPNGKLIVSASNDKTIKLWDVFTGKLVNEFIGHTEKVQTALFSPDGRFLVSTSGDDTIRLWDIGKGKQKGAPLVAHTVRSVPLVSDLDFNSIVPENSDITSFPVMNEPIEKHMINCTARVSFAAFSPNGKNLVSASENEIRIWDVAYGKQMREPLVGHTDTINSVQFNYDGSYIVSASDDQTIRLWDAATGKQLEVLSGHTSGVKYASFSPNGNEIVSASWDNTIRIWNITNNKHYRIRHKNAEYTTFSKDGKYIISAGWGTVKLIEARTRKQIKEFQGSIGSISDNSDYVVLSGYDNNIRLTEPFIKEFPQKKLSTNSRIAYCAIFSPNGRIVVSASSDNLLKIWDAETGILKDSYKFTLGAIHHLSFSPDGRLLIISSWESTRFYIWNIKTKQIVASYSHDTGVNSAVFSPDGKFIVSASKDGIVKKWNLSTQEQEGEDMNALPIRAHCDISVTYNPCGNQFLTVSRSVNTIRIWDSKTCEQICNTICGRSANFSPDGKCLIIADDDSIKVLDLSSQEHIAVFYLKDIFGAIDIVSFSPDGKYLLSATCWGQICIWDVMSCQIIDKWYVEGGVDNCIHSAIFSQNGKKILTASESGAIQIWSFPSLQELISDTQKRFKNNQLTFEERKKYYIG